MDVFEEVVLKHLTTYGKATFVCPHFLDHPKKSNKKGPPRRNIDFVALDLIKRVVSIIEVSSAGESGIKKLILKIKNRHNRLYMPVKRDLRRIIGDDWKYKVVVFIKWGMRKKFNKIDLKKTPKVRFVNLDKVLKNYTNY